MTRYDVIRKRIALLKGNKIGGKFLSVQSLAEETGYTKDEIRPIVQQLINEHSLKFKKIFVDYNSKTYDIEHLEKKTARGPRLLQRDNRWMYK